MGLWAKIYEVTGVTKGPLQGATMQVWKDGTNYKLTITNDPAYNGTYAKTGTINQSGAPFELIKFADVGSTAFYYKPGNEDGIIFIGSGAIEVVDE